MLWWFPSQLHPIWGPGQGQEGLLGNLENPGVWAGVCGANPKASLLAPPAGRSCLSFSGRLHLVLCEPPPRRAAAGAHRGAGRRARSWHSWSHLPSSGAAGVQGEEGKDTRPPSGQRGLRPSPFWGLLEVARALSMLRGGERKRAGGSQALDLRGAVCQGRSGQAAGSSSLRPAPPH